MLQNDLVNLMNIIEKNMQIYFKNEGEKVQIQEKTEKVIETEPITISVTEEPKDNKKQSNDLKLPFARIDVVSPNSPAEEAGLKEGDKITLFEYVTYADGDPLKKIAEIVGKKIGQAIKVEVMRKEKLSDHDDHERLIYVLIELIPKTWSGQGVLG